MSELRQEVLQAEVAIRELAEELAKAKGLVDNVTVIEQRLSEAAKMMEQSYHQGERLRATLDSTANSIVQAIKDFGDRVSQLLRETRADLGNVTSTLNEMRTSLNQRIDIVQRSLEQISQIQEKQNAVIGRLLRWIQVCCIFVVISILSNFIIIVLILSRR